MEEVPEAALRAAACIAVAFPSDAAHAIVTPRGRLHLKQIGSGFFLRRMGFVLTCEHVRRAARRFQAKCGGHLIVCPYVGNDRPISLTHALEAKVLAYTDLGAYDKDHLPIDEPTGSNAVNVGGTADAAVLCVHHELVSGTPIRSEPPLGSISLPNIGTDVPVLQIGENLMRPTQTIFAIGFPVGFEFGTTPTPSRGSNALRMSDSDGAWIKFEGMVSPGHSGGPAVTADGVVIGWNCRNNLPVRGVSGINHLRPIEAARPCIEAALAHPSLQAADAPSWANLCAPPPPPTIPHSPTLAPDEHAPKIFGRDEEAHGLYKALCDASTPSKHYYLVMGAAGLGKTALVESVGRMIVSAGGARFSAIVFVELRARDTCEKVNAAVDDALRGAGLSTREQLRDALVILDNADDPYKEPSNVSGRWFEGPREDALLPRLEACRPAALLITLRDEGHRSLFMRDVVRGAHRTQLGPLPREVGIEMLSHLTQPEARPRLSEDEQQQVLSASGSRGVSPLALSIVCGVLRSRLTAPDAMLFDRAEFLHGLLANITGADDFKRVQEVMACSFNYLQQDVRAAFLQLHLFPDTFTLADAAVLWGVEQRRAKELLSSMLAFNVVCVRRSQTNENCFLILDHIWLFATKHAEDPGSEWLSRTQFVDAVMRLIWLAHERWPPSARANEAALPRLFHAACFHARKVLHIAQKASKDDSGQGYRGLPTLPPDDSLRSSDMAASDSDEPPMYRSLAMDALPYGDRTGGLGVASADADDRPICFEDVTQELRMAAEELLDTKVR